ncbi:MAG: NAD(P)H-dependent oxidoreductase subunit E [Thermoprotei archaeon]|nr:MAG: NAD(P)H-dependent oxidoreductase subunit E [Thermoprotei archaeon]RLE97760.1 MAG: NAD(P)H-dependent oxidoreductase subunit E [Thermoprotei archaeon]
MRADILGAVREAIALKGDSPSALIPVLQHIQGRLGYLPREALIEVSRRLGVPLSRVYGVATFYHQFSLTPPAPFTIYVCMGTACHLRGNAENYELLRRLLKIKPGTNVSADGLFKLEKARCFGCCSLAPVIKVNEDLYGRVSAQEIRRIVSRYRALARRLRALPPARRHV